jgi:beta-1,4-mannosyltransferase
MKVLASPYLETADYNPVQSLLYLAMENCGAQVASFSTRRLLSESWDIWHLHWPESIVNREDNLRIITNLFKFWVKLKVARAKKTKIFWTVHNLRPHERNHPLLEKVFWRIFLPNIDGIISMYESGTQHLYREHPQARAHPVYIIPHGHYRGAYPDSVTREDARRVVGAKAGEFVIMFFGQIRQYKGIPHLIRSFVAAKLPCTRLIIAGKPGTHSIAGELKKIADSNSQINLFFDFIDRNDMQNYLRAADLVVLPYNEILNSGSAILALSFDRPILVPAQGAMAELHQAVGPDWVHLYEGQLTPEIICDAIRWANCGQKKNKSEVLLTELNWDRIARMTIEAFSH